MTFEDLNWLVYDWANRPWANGTRLGCECGCGGDRYTPELWKESCVEAEEAKKKLLEFGVTFNDD